MNFGPVTPLLVTDDMPATIAFYRDSYGFEQRFAVPKDQPFFCILGRGAAQIMFKDVAGIAPAPNNRRHEFLSFDFFIYCDDPAELGDAANTDDGLFGFKFSDPNGYIGFIGHPVEADA